LGYRGSKEFCLGWVAWPHNKEWAEPLGESGRLSKTGSGFARGSIANVEQTPIRLKIDKPQDN
jgi:hypothetical protein